MRKGKEKKTATTTTTCLQRLLWISGRCYSHECGCGLRAGRGFTLVETLLVVLIIAIAALITVPMMGSTESVQIRSAANVIAADLEYAKSMAISRQKYYSMVFDPVNNCYEIHDPDGIIEHPVKKGFDYKVDFSSDSRLNKVVIESADFDSAETITFDYLGSPYSGSGSSPAFLNGEGQIQLRAGDFTKTIRVEPVTGFISITD